MAGCFQQEGARTSVAPEEVAVVVEEDRFGGVEDQLYSVVVEDGLVVPAG